MEDAATAEISRAQVWQWTHHPEGILEDGREVTMALIHQIMQEELSKIRTEVGDRQFNEIPYEQAQRLFEEIIANPDFEEFLTLKAYERLD